MVTSSLNVTCTFATGVQEAVEVADEIVVEMVFVLEVEEEVRVELDTGTAPLIAMSAHVR